MLKQVIKDIVRWVRGCGDWARCMECGRSYDTAYWVPFELWTKVSGRRDGSGRLCIKCCDSMALSKGIKLYWEACEGHYPTENHYGKVPERPPDMTGP